MEGGCCRRRESPGDTVHRCCRRLSPPPPFHNQACRIVLPPFSWASSVAIARRQTAPQKEARHLRGGPICGGAHTFGWYLLATQCQADSQFDLPQIKLQEPTPHSGHDAGGSTVVGQHSRPAAGRGRRAAAPRPTEACGRDAGMARAVGAVRGERTHKATCTDCFCALV